MTKQQMIELEEEKLKKELMKYKEMLEAELEEVKKKLRELVTPK